MKNRFKQALTLVILFLLNIPLWGHAQDSSHKYMRKTRPLYIQVGGGFSASSFTDFATSPLRYSGSAPRYTIGIIRSDKKLESNFNLSFMRGVFSRNADDRVFQSMVRTLFISYSRLYHIKKLSTEKLDTRLGGMIDITGNLRQNPSLYNNSFGAELFNTLFLSGKTSYDLSRKETKTGKFLWLFKYTRPPRQRNINFQLNVALINNTYRNGYAYLNPTSVANDFKPAYGYQYKWFSGYRLSSALDYCWYYTNGNGIKIAYLWDAYKTGGNLDKFQMANHYFMLSLLFRVK